MKIQYDPYQYIIKNPWSVRVFYACGILAWLFTMYGFIRFFQIDWLYAVLVAPMILIFSLYHFTSDGINLFYKSFDVAIHDLKVRNFWTRSPNPNVDVFLPVCGEPLEILRKTFEGVRDMKYQNKTVYVLDDKGQPGLEQLSREFGFTYRSRPNKGEMKKAGNLNFGFNNSTGEFIVIFDADFVPHENFLRELLPYMDDPKIAIVQAPQYFPTDAEVHTRSPLEFGAGHVQEDFYRIIQQSRNTFGGAICVGSNAIYRRSALDTIGGTVQIEHSEDVHTGFRLVDKGFKIQYVPLILAIGLCPSSMHAYFHQQHRWCSGSMSLMLDKKFWTSRLTPAQKLCYSSGFLYYITHGLSLLLGFQIFLILFRHFESITLWGALPFLPYIFYCFVCIPLFRVTRAKMGTLIARQSHNFSYGQALIRNLIGRPIGWKPTGEHAALSREYVHVLHMKSLYLTIYVAMLSTAIALHMFPVFNWVYLSVNFWIIYGIVTNGLMLYHAYVNAGDIMNEKGAPRREISTWTFKHIAPYVALFILLPTVSIAYNVTTPNARIAERQETLTGDGSPESVEAVKTTNIQPEGKEIRKTVIETQTFRQVAKRGDSVFTLTRKAIRTAHPSLAPWERVYVETVLATPRKRQIPEGTVIELTADEIERAIASLKTQSRKQIAVWEAYARKIDWAE